MIPTGAKVGDKLVLTKPLGMQLAVNSFQWLKGDMKQWQVAREFISEEQVLGIRCLFRRVRTGG